MRPELSSAAVVSLLNVIEHLEAPDAVLSALGSTMRTGPHLVTECPRYPSLGGLVALGLPELSARLVIPLWHLRFYSEKSLELSLKRYGFTLVVAVKNDAENQRP